LPSRRGWRPFRGKPSSSTARRFVQPDDSDSIRRNCPRRSIRSGLTPRHAKRILILSPGSGSIQLDVRKNAAQPFRKESRLHRAAGSEIRSKTNLGRRQETAQIAPTEERAESSCRRLPPRRAAHALQLRHPMRGRTN
jgi:hypothetical protein